jgi:hypothetical protein
VRESGNKINLSSGDREWSFGAGWQQANDWPVASDLAFYGFGLFPIDPSDASRTRLGLCELELHSQPSASLLSLRCLQAPSYFDYTALSAATSRAQSTSSDPPPFVTCLAYFSQTANKPTANRSAFRQTATGAITEHKRVK